MVKKDNQEIVAYGLAIGFGLTGLGFLLYFIATTIGIVVKIVSDKFTFPILTFWGVPLVSAGLAIGGGAAGIYVLNLVVKGAKKNPYEWTLPILAIISALIIDTCKELYSDNAIIRIFFGTSVAGLYLLGGILWRQKKRNFKWFIVKAISIIIFLLPPIFIYLSYLKKSYKEMPPHVFLSICILLIFLVIITCLSWIFKDDDN